MAIDGYLRTELALAIFSRRWASLMEPMTAEVTPALLRTKSKLALMGSSIDFSSVISPLARAFFRKIPLLFSRA